MTLSRQRRTMSAPNRSSEPTDSATVSKNTHSQVNRFFAVATILVLVAFFILGGLTIKRAYPPVPLIRSGLERELASYQGRLEKKPEDIETRVAAAKIYVRLGKTKMATDELNRVLKMRPKYWDGLFQLGLVYLSDGKKQRAITQFKKAANAKPSEGLAYYQLGLIAHGDKRFETAVKYLEKTVKISPVLADAHYYLANSYQRLGHKGPAKQHYEEALRYIPDYTEAKKGLAGVERD
ncbi:MAG TPA: tetratricopeptide repeat protein [Actinobacteria bacterium]|nr:tetratricopeptide repeat protein [Actinomycetota bacterium]